jgi:L-asparaginase
MQDPGGKIVILGTGGTIAGVGAAGVSDRYVAGQIGIEQILSSLAPAISEQFADRIVWEQVFQTDSKDMSWSLLRQLGQRCDALLADDSVDTLVITHGTDTMEETAYLLHSCLPWHHCGKPVVLTGAMRPATAHQPDGPVNLAQALCVADSAAKNRHCGVWLSFAGDVHHAVDVQKTDPTGLHAFTSMSKPAAARVEGQQVHWRDACPPHSVKPVCAGHPSLWSVEALPRVEIVHSHAGADGEMVRDLIQTRGTPVRGIVVAGTGNGTIAAPLEEALSQAVNAGIRVVRATRCAQGRVLTDFANRFEPAHDLDTHALTPAKARWALILSLLAERA